jgi:hypothetical protein
MAKKKITKKTKENEKVFVLAVLAVIFALALVVVIIFTGVFGKCLNPFKSLQVNLTAANEVAAGDVTGDGDFWFDYLDSGDFTSAQCSEIKRVWDAGLWTDNFGSLYAPDICKSLGFWSTSGVSGDVIPEGYEGDLYIAYENNPFPDTDVNALAGVAAAYLYNIGVISGYPDGEFKGERDVNRAEAAKFLLTARFSDVEDVGNSGQFSDVEAGQWYVKYVVTAADLGVISGYPNGTFMPANTVNTAEFLKMLTLTFDLDLNLFYGFTDIEAGAWYEPYVGTAYKYNLFPHRGDLLDPGSLLTRNEVASAIFQYLAQP